MVRIYSGILFLFFFVALPGKAFAATYYVATNGSDSNAGSPSSPWKTIQKAANTAVAGDSVYVRGGTYPEQVSFTRSGTSSSRITFAAYQSEVPVIDGSGFTSTTYDGLVQVRDGVHYLTFSGFTIKRAPDMGLANRGSYNIFANNKILLSYDTGIWHRFGHDTVYRNNEVYLNERSNATSASDTSIVCSNNTTGWPAALNSQRAAGTSSLWEGNYVHNNCGEGIVSNDGDQIIGNTFRDNWSINIYVDEAVGVVVDRNFVYETETTYIPRGNDNYYKNLASGLFVADEAACLAHDNLFTNNIVVNTRHGFGYYQYSACSGIINTKIINNTIVNSWDYAFRIPGSVSGNAGSIIANNIIYTKQGKAMILENPANFKILNNLWYFSSGSLTGQFQWGSTSYDYSTWSNLSASITGNRLGDPLFTGTIPLDPTQNNPALYALQSTSPAINTGITVANIPSGDYEGNARPGGSSWDIGAYEYGSGGGAKPGDLDGNGTVNIFDFNLLISRFGNPYTIFDFNQIVGNYGK